MSNGGLNPKSRIHPERLTQAHQWSHWYMKGSDGWRECVREHECLSVLEWVCVWVCERKRFTRTNPPDAECEASSRHSWLPGSRPLSLISPWPADIRRMFSCWQKHLTVFLSLDPSFNFSLVSITSFILKWTTNVLILCIFMCTDQYHVEAHGNSVLCLDSASHTRGWQA